VGVNTVAACDAGLALALSAVAMVLTTLAVAPSAQAIAIVAAARTRDLERSWDIDRLLFCIIEKFQTAFHSRRNAVSGESPFVAVSRWGERG